MRPFDRLRAMTRAAHTEERGAGIGEYACHGCERRFEVQYHSCPDCGSFAVQSVRYDPPPG